MNRSENYPVFFTGATLSAIPVETLEFFTAENAMLAGLFIGKIVFTGVVSVGLNKLFNKAKDKPKT